MLIVASVLALLLALTAYRRGLGGEGRWWLLALRLIALGGLFVVLSGSALNWRWRTRSGRVVVLIDRSGSVAATHHDSAVDGIARTVTLPASSRREDWWFADTVVRGNDRDLPAARRTRTNIGKAIRQAGLSRPGAIVLLTDGQDNGQADVISEARSIDTPVWVIGLGDVVARNLAIEQVLLPPRVYVGESTTVSVRVSAVSDSDATIRVALGATRRELHVPAGDVQVDCDFPVVFGSVGPTSIVVTVDSLRGESNLSDNVRSQSLEVLPSRFDVVCVVGVPGPTSRFVLNALRDDGRFGLSSLGPGESDTVRLRRADVVVLSDVSEDGCSPALLTALERRARTRFGVLLLGGPATQLGRRLGGILGVSGGQSATGQFVPRLARSGRPVPWLDGFQRGGSTVIPVERTLQFEYVAGDWQTWLQAEGTGEQLLVSGQNGSVGVLVMAGHPVWRWGLGRAVGHDRSLLSELVVGAVRYLAEAGLPPLQLSSDRETYYVGEPVSLKMTASAPGGGAWSRLSVTLALASGESLLQSAIPMTEVGPGVYEATVAGLGAGGYDATAVAVSDSVAVGRAAVAFVVSDRSIETARLGLNEPLLRSVAAVTGGRYMPAGSAVPGGLPIEMATHVVGLSFDFRRAAVIYVLIAAICAVEWLARRRKGLL
jgi:hypothetical protein